MIIPIDVARDEPNVGRPSSLRSSFQVILSYVKLTITVSCHNNLQLADANSYSSPSASQGYHEIRIDKTCKVFCWLF